ncbi:MAG: hypothetical protein A3E88_01635 [Legionellales bacterium RIFCSPHIGHO2_12_FULL_35_11]|nr:MAG: hypothetical protein A3E88_01635 [Legionellales bacterium RIFCSPHIGHO2_12_FULL_35_11]
MEASAWLAPVVLTSSASLALYGAIWGAIYKAAGVKLMASIGAIALSGFVGGLILIPAYCILSSLISYLINIRINELNKYQDKNLISHYNSLQSSIDKLLFFAATLLGLIVGGLVLGVSINPLLLIPMGITLALPTLFFFGQFCYSLCGVLTTKANKESPLAYGSLFPPNPSMNDFSTDTNQGLSLIK